MNSPETPLQMAQRYVAEGSTRVTDQTARIATLIQQGHDTAAAELLLSIMKEALLLSQAHLSEEQERAGQ